MDDDVDDNDGVAVQKMVMMPTKLLVFQNEDDDAPGGDNIWQSRFLPRDAWPSCLAKRLANKKI